MFNGNRPLPDFARFQILDDANILVSVGPLVGRNSYSAHLVDHEKPPCELPLRNIASLGRQERHSIE